jgi:IS30 family transposase
MNGWVRKFIPKNRVLISVREDKLEQIMIKLNFRPRKCLDFKSPIEVSFEQSVALVI